MKEYLNLHQTSKAPERYANNRRSLLKYPSHIT